MSELIKKDGECWYECGCGIFMNLTQFMQYDLPRYIGVECPYCGSEHEILLEDD